MAHRVAIDMPRWPPTSGSRRGRDVDTVRGLGSQGGCTVRPALDASLSGVHLLSSSLARGSDIRGRVRFTVLTVISEILASGCTVQLGRRRLPATPSPFEHAQCRSDQGHGLRRPRRGSVQRRQWRASGTADEVNDINGTFSAISRVAHAAAVCGSGTGRLSHDRTN